MALAKWWPSWEENLGLPTCLNDGHEEQACCPSGCNTQESLAQKLKDSLKNWLLRNYMTSVGTLGGPV